MSQSPAIEVTGVSKSFKIRGRARQPAGETLAHPFRRRRGRRLRVLHDLSFDVTQGEFFGVVGRNGSGKSTLLKLLASIYRPDGGRIRLAGQLAPFIELGLGFHPELVALDNVVLNGVMMGLGPHEARRRFDEIISFAGLEDYTDLKLKNYSSGMKVRLGFSVMSHVDADILLIDEVLAVGDAAFQNKCAQVFRRLHDEGKTIVLVTHSMPLMEEFCERAMLIHDGLIERIGEPTDVASRYLELNVLEMLHGGAEDAEGARRALPARVAELALGDGGSAPPVVEDGAPLEVRASIEVDAPIDRPGVFVEIQTKDRQKIFSSPLVALGEDPHGVVPGERLWARATIDNRLAAGSYVLNCAVGRDDPEGGRVLLSAPKRTPFEVSGEARLPGLVMLDHEVRFGREAAAGAAAQ